MNKASVLASVALLLVLVDCAPAPKPQNIEMSAAATGAVLPGDAQLLKIAEVMPSFGGMFVDEEMNFNIYLKNDLQRLSPRSREALAERAGTVITYILGSDFILQATSRRSERDDTAPIAGRPRVRLVQGTYDVAQLARWRAELDRQLLAVPGVVFTDLDERRNRLIVGVEASVSRATLEAALKNLGIPREAVLVEDAKPIRFQATLRSRIRPPPGGMQVEADTGVFAFSTCTLGFNAIRASVGGFVTNSHCTRTQGGSEGTDFHQPDDPLFSEGNKVGDEIADPPYLTEGACPSGRRCRFSDSAFVDYSVARGSNIARTTGWNNGSLTIRDSRPRLFIVGETSTWADGSELDKIGRTTGWTYGRVDGTCRNVNVADSNVTLFCQYGVNRLPDRTHKMSDNGDSGSPVFRWLGSDVILAGILWGGTDDGSLFAFSPMTQVEQELGFLTTFNFPAPPSQPTQCFVTQKCCGVIGPDGKCDGQCWPINNPCP